MTSRHTFLLIAAAEILAAQPGRFGLPSCQGEGLELASRPGFVLCHSAQHKAPLWVAHELRRGSPVASRPRRFRRDDGLVSPGASDADYVRSGYTRGHMAPAEDMAWSEETMRATFLLSNVIPQPRWANCGAWRRLEEELRIRAARADAVYVVTGPTFSAEPERIGVGGVAVPTHVFKVALVIDGGELTMFAAMLTNAIEPGTGLEFTSVKEIEETTGLDFFPALGDTTSAGVSCRVLPGLRDASCQRASRGRNQ